MTTVHGVSCLWFKNINKWKQNAKETPCPTQECFSFIFNACLMKMFRIKICMTSEPKNMHIMTKVFLENATMFLNYGYFLLFIIIIILHLKFHAKISTITSILNYIFNFSYSFMMCTNLFKIYSPNIKSLSFLEVFWKMV